ncbi:MAG: MYXO-CTERM sorting domain-containing protein [Nannocystales bacterium]
MERIGPLLEGRIDVEPERIIHVAPLPGEDGDGTAANPRRDLKTVVEEAEAGTAIHLAPGVYDMSAIAETFGHATSRLITGHDGESGRPIVLRTDPEAYVVGSEVAVLDFDYENTGDWSSSAFVARNDYWVYERFELRRVYRRAFTGFGRECTFRELELHHADTDGTDNDALLVMTASGGGANNVVLQNHLHHVGILDRETDELVEISGVNSGCYYSVTRLTYDSGTPEAGDDATRAEWEAVLEPPDGDVHVVANHVHDCHYGLGLKNVSRGPYHFSSNYIHDTDYGIMSPFRETVVTNNVIHDAGIGIRLGRAQTNGPLMTFLKMTGNGAHSEVAFNTVVNATRGLEFSGGWGTEVHHNLVVDAEEPVAIQRNTFSWWEDGQWPGLRGEFLVGDMNEAHPFYDVVPAYVHETPEEFRAMSLADNCYDMEPSIAAVDFVQDLADITGMVFDLDYVVLGAQDRAGLFADEAQHDYRRAEDGYECGALLKQPRDPGEGGTGGSGRPGESGDASTSGGDSGGETGTGSVETGEPGTGASGASTGAEDVPGQDSDGGCGCSSTPHPGPATLWLFAVGLALRRRTRVPSRRKGDRNPR